MSVTTAAGAWQEHYGSTHWGSTECEQEYIQSLATSCDAEAIPAQLSFHMCAHLQQ